MDRVTYQQLLDWTQTEGIGHHPSEVHGLVTGWVCAGAGGDAGGFRAGLANWLDADPDNSTFRQIETIREQATTDLADEELGFRLLMPQDDVPLAERTKAISQWCTGFLSGFGMTGRYRQSELSGELAEILTDLSRVSQIEEDVPDDEENEADLTEIIEFVRMAALLVYTECARSIH